MKQLLLSLSIVAISMVMYRCGSGPQNSSSDSTTTPDASLKQSESASSTTDDSKGKGKFTEVKLTHPLDKKMIDSGKIVYEVKCASCHKLGAEKLVGPGWKGVTDRRTPEWIMNFITNTDEMIDKDPAARAMLEECMVRMPNQNLRDEEARSLLEYMRHNDGKN